MRNRSGLFVFLAVLVLCFAFSGTVFAAEELSSPSLVLSPALLDANRNVTFSREVFITASTTNGRVSDLSLNPTSWNGLTLNLSQTDRKISISGRPTVSGSPVFTVSGKIDGVPVDDATFTVRVSDVATYSLTAVPDMLSTPRGAYVNNTIVIDSNTGTAPTNLTVNSSSWNGLQINVSSSNNRVTIVGTPNRNGTQVFTISGRVNGVLASSPATYTVTVFGAGNDEESSSGCNAGLTSGIALAVLSLFLFRKK